MPAITDRCNETEARIKVETIMQEPMVCRIGLEMMADAILFANSLSGNIWAVTNTDNYPDSIWLQVGHYAVMMLTEGQI
jgi:hypothetical protein